MVNKTTKQIMQKHNFTKDTIFFRVIRNTDIVGEKRKFFVEGNRRSGTNVVDKENDRKTWASHLADPGINVTKQLSREYTTESGFVINVKLEDILKAGGKIYYDVGSADTGSWYLTIPEGKRVPIEIYSGEEYKAKLSCIYNKELKKVGREVAVSEWEHEDDNLFRASLYNFKNPKPVYGIGYLMNNETLEIKRIGRMNEDMDIVDGATEIKGKEQIMNSILLRIAIQHTELKKIIYSDGKEEKIEEFLKRIN